MNRYSQVFYKNVIIPSNIAIHIVLLRPIFHYINSNSDVARHVLVTSLSPSVILLPTSLHSHAIVFDASVELQKTKTIQIFVENLLLYCK